MPVQLADEVLEGDGGNVLVTVTLRLLVDESLLAVRVVSEVKVASDSVPDLVDE